jgi:hypothetical protein
MGFLTAENSFLIICAKEINAKELAISFASQVVARVIVADA